MHDSDPTTHPATKVRVIPSLTGIRGIAAVWVLLYHLHAISDGNGYVLGLPGKRIWWSGWTGVDLFFILSGFMLMHSNGREFGTWTYKSLRNFFVTRVFRVYPLATVTLLVVLLLVLAYPEFASDFRQRSAGNLSAQAFLRTAVLATRWFPAAGAWNEPVWSLSAEIVGYAFFPLLAFALLKCRSSRVALCVTAVALIATMAGQFAMGKFAENDLSQTGALLRMAGYFTAGIALRRYLDLSSFKPGNTLISIVAAVSALGILSMPFSGKGVGIMPIFYATMICAL